METVPEVVRDLPSGRVGRVACEQVDERGSCELVTDEAFSEMEEAMKRGEIATVAQAHEFLCSRGVHYSHPESVGGLLRRRKVKLKTGRPRHEKADREEQETFKKSSRAN